MTVVILAVVMPVEDLFKNKMPRVVTEKCERLRKTWIIVFECLRKKSSENKMARCGLVVGGCRSANRADLLRKMAELYQCRK